MIRSSTNVSCKFLLLLKSLQNVSAGILHLVSKVNKCLNKCHQRKRIALEKRDKRDKTRGI